MWIDLVLLALGLALLVKGGELFVASAVRIAEFLRMPRVVIGSTLVSLATTTPELVVSITAGAHGEPGLAVGNAVGSCICNIGLILGVTAALKQVDVHLSTLRTPLIAMFGVGLLLMIMTLNLGLEKWQGWLLIGGGVAYFAFDFVHHARSRTPALIAEAAAIEKEETRLAWSRSLWGSVAQFAVAALIVIAGSRLLVGSAVDIASRLGVPPIVIGLTVVALGTSLPELITAVTSARRNVSDLAVGNVLGANIANLTFIVGTAAVMSRVTMSRLTQVFNFTALVLVFGLLLWMLVSDRRVTRKEGITLLVFYLFYICGVVFLTAALKA